MSRHFLLESLCRSLQSPPAHRTLAAMNVSRHQIADFVRSTTFVLLVPRMRRLQVAARVPVHMAKGVTSLPVVTHQQLRATRIVAQISTIALAVLQQLGVAGACKMVHVFLVMHLMQIVRVLAQMALAVGSTLLAVLTTSLSTSKFLDRPKLSALSMRFLTWDCLIWWLTSQQQRRCSTKQHQFCTPLGCQLSQLALRPALAAHRANTLSDFC